MRESYYQTVLINSLQDAGAYILNVHGHAFQKRGWPDLQVYSQIWTGHLELKIRNAKLSKIQEEVMEQLKIRGTAVYVIRIFEDYFILDGLTSFEGVTTKMDKPFLNDGAVILDTLAKLSRINKEYGI